VEFVQILHDKLEADLAHSSAVIQCWKGVSWERERRGEERRERKEEEREERGERREERARIERLGIHEEGWREMLVPLGRGRFTSSHTSQKLHPSNCINWINKNLQAYKRKREEKKKQKNGNGKRDKKKVTWGCHPNALAYHAAVSLLFLVLMLTHWTLEGLMARINNSIECKWKSGRVEEWKSGRVEEWKSGRVEEWKSGRVEESGRKSNRNDERKYKREEWNMKKMFVHWLRRAHIKFKFLLDVTVRHLEAKKYKNKIYICWCCKEYTKNKNEGNQLAFYVVGIGPAHLPAIPFSFICTCFSWNINVGVI
jgi:hypothetical protein